MNIQWLRKTNRKPLLAAVEKMKEGTWSVFEQKSEACNSFLNLDFFTAELMLLGFISLLLTATSSIIANICISSKFYNSAFAPCTRSAVDEDNENNASHERKLLTAFGFPHLSRRVLNTLNENTCKQAHDSSYVFLSSRFPNLILKSCTYLYRSNLWKWFCYTGLWAVCIVWRTWATTQVHICYGNYAYIL